MSDREAQFVLPHIIIYTYIISLYIVNIITCKCVLISTSIEFHTFIFSTRKHTQSHHILTQRFFCVLFSGIIRFHVYSHVCNFYIIVLWVFARFYRLICVFFPPKTPFMHTNIHTNTLTLWERDSSSVAYNLVRLAIFLLIRS